MLRTFAIIKISVPSTDIEKIRAYAGIMSGGTMTTVYQYLTQQMFNFSAAFGPNCSGVIQSTGQEEDV